ncbi:C-C motif chemokine 19-like [Anableps anableps]
MFKMSTKILLVGLLLLAVSQCVHASPAHYPTGKNRPCCLNVTRKDLRSQVVGTVFYNQPARFPCVRAVIFNMDSGPVCVHPKDPWVQEVIASFRRKD